jgi:hypothetical protein
MARNILPLIRAGDRFTMTLDQLKLVAAEVGVSFRQKQRRTIIDLLAEYSIHEPFDRNSVAAGPARRVLQRLVASLKDIDDQLMALNESQRFDLISCLNERLEIRDSAAHCPFDLMFADLLASSEEALSRIVSEYGGRGRPRKSGSREELILGLADIYSKSGKAAGAWYRDADGKRHSPFLRFVLALNKELPPHIRMSAERLPEFVHEVCEARSKRQRAKSRKKSPRKS